MHNPYEMPEEPYYMMDELIEAFKSKSLVVCHMHRQLTIGMPQLRLHYRARGASIQRLHNGRIETEMSIFDNTFLKVTV